MRDKKWTLRELLKVLNRIAEMDEGMHLDDTVSVLIETENKKPCQYQFPMNDVAVSSRGEVIIMHEKWGRK